MDDIHGLHGFRGDHSKDDKLAMLVVMSTPSFFACAFTDSRCSRAAFSAFSRSWGAIVAYSGFVSITDIAESLLEHFFAS
jgi:hypothetical protein